MTLPTWEELAVYLQEERKINIPSTFYGKYEYIKDFFFDKPFNDSTARILLSKIQNDLYYRQGEYSFAREQNEYISILKIINEYYIYIKKKLADISGGTPFNLTYAEVRSFYLNRRGIRGPERQFKKRFEEIQRYFFDKPYTLENVDQFLTDKKAKFKVEHGQEMSTGYYNKYVSQLRAYCEMLRVDFAKDILRKHAVYKETEKLTTEEFNRLLSVDLIYSRQGQEINFRWKTLIATLFITTARPGEMSSAKWSDLKDNYLHFPITKNGHPHKVYLPTSLLTDMNKLQRYDHDYIFGSSGGPFKPGNLNIELKERCRIAGINKIITGRSMRGSGITAYLKTYEIHKVAKISNHASVDTIYKHYYKPENEEIEDIVRHNVIKPEEASGEELKKAYLSVGEKYKSTRYSDVIEKVEEYIKKLI